MHFYYLDESGCTGNDLANPEQPIFVLGGLSVRDEGWGPTQEAFQAAVEQYFGGNVPAGFELHAEQLLSPSGAGPFQDHDRDQRNAFALAMLDLLRTRRHDAHFIAVDKHRVNATAANAAWPFNAKVPYLLGFDYMLTHINWILRTVLGRSARGLIIFDAKPQFSDDVTRISHERRFKGPQNHRVKHIVELAYPADSFKNPMVQLSDLVAFCTRKFLEVEGGYRNAWLVQAKQFYARCFAKIDRRVRRKALVKRAEPSMVAFNGYLATVAASPRGKWRKRYGVQND